MTAFSLRCYSNRTKRVQTDDPFEDGVTCYQRMDSGFQDQITLHFLFQEALRTDIKIVGLVPKLGALAGIESGTLGNKGHNHLANLELVTKQVLATKKINVSRWTKSCSFLNVSLQNVDFDVNKKFHDAKVKQTRSTGEVFNLMRVPFSGWLKTRTKGRQHEDEGETKKWGWSKRRWGQSE